MSLDIPLGAIFYEKRMEKQCTRQGKIPQATRAFLEMSEIATQTNVPLQKPLYHDTGPYHPRIITHFNYVDTYIRLYFINHR